MNKTSESAHSLFQEINNRANEFGDTEVIVFPPSLYIDRLTKIAHPRLGVGAQDVSAHLDQGAYTGEYTAEMLKSVGGKYAIVGHSERRHYHHETDEIISRKIRACIHAGIIPIYCCGESEEHRESNSHVDVVQSQVLKALAGFTAGNLRTLIIAYEPVWAIGTGKTATADQAQEMHEEIRKMLEKQFGSEFSESVQILYGGSCKPSNAKEIFDQKDVDGGLIGGASLTANDFLGIIAAANS